MTLAVRTEKWLAALLLAAPMAHRRMSMVLAHVDGATVRAECLVAPSLFAQPTLCARIVWKHAQQPCQSDAPTMRLTRCRMSHYHHSSSDEVAE